MAIRWEEWGEAAFHRARAEKKPVLLALTATWCHACHRMDQETWSTPGVASRIAATTVPVRADADRRPDLHARYHLGGLPSVVLLTLDGEFIRGGTFLLPPQLLAFLEAGLEDFASGRRRADAGRQRCGEVVEPAALVETQIGALRRRFDPEHGGFDLSPKLPHADALTFLLRQWRRSGDPEVAGIVKRSLEALRDGLSDGEAGGFFRYAAGADWSHPHTEKLATEQAALIRLFTEAGQRLGEPRYWSLARGAGGYALGWLGDPGGGFFGSQAASPGYYQMAPEERLQENPPAVDRTVFADSTASLAAALLYTSCVLNLSEWEVRGRVAVERLMASAPGGRIPHTLSEGPGVYGWLMDQALGLNAALWAYQLSGDPRFLRWGIRVAEWSLDRLWDSSCGAFLDMRSDEEMLGYLARPVTPVRPNAEMAGALLDLSILAGEPRFEEKATALIAWLGRGGARSPVAPAVALVASRPREDRVVAVVAGPPTDPIARELARAVITVAGPTALVCWEPGARALVTCCTRNLCLPPMDDPKRLRESLAEVGLSA